MNKYGGILSPGQSILHDYMSEFQDDHHISRTFALRSPYDRIWDARLSVGGIRQAGAADPTKQESQSDFVESLKPKVKALATFGAGLDHHERLDLDGQRRIVSTRSTEEEGILKGSQDFEDPL
uniref:AlNc14C58G4334 protein n=1 Tax=Albugo laibachii Nc14 TaxID=890382 RepID=F0WCF4_9STRA|nr:AlNc14C58G4334 [Albugo laibachii Nc14]|eukprot:CCA18869.1 AlNc14C58G4334 [Albugo laibachii Nc14]